MGGLPAIGGTSSSVDFVRSVSGKSGGSGVSSAFDGLAVTKSGGSGASSIGGAFSLAGGAAFGVSLSFAGVSLGKSDFDFGGDAGVVETCCGASLEGVAGAFKADAPRVFAKSLPKNEPLAGGCRLRGVIFCCAITRKSGAELEATCETKETL